MIKNFNDFINENHTKVQLSDKITEMKNVDVTKYAPELVEAFDKAIEDAEQCINGEDYAERYTSASRATLS